MCWLRYMEKKKHNLFKSTNIYLLFRRFINVRSNYKLNFYLLSRHALLLLEHFLFYFKVSIFLDDYQFWFLLSLLLWLFSLLLLLLLLLLFSLLLLLLLLLLLFCHCHCYYYFFICNIFIFCQYRFYHSIL